MMRDPNDLNQQIELTKKAEENRKIEDSIIREQKKRVEANTFSLMSRAGVRLHCENYPAAARIQS